MSLIHDALRDMDGGAAQPKPGAVPPPARVPAPAPTKRSGSDWLGGVAAFGVVVAAGVGGWMLFGPGARSLPPAPVQLAPAAAPAVTAAAAPQAAPAPAPAAAGTAAPAAAAPGTAPVPVPAPVPAPVAAAAPTPAASPAPSPAVTAAAGADRSRPAAAATAAGGTPRAVARKPTAAAPAPAAAASEPVDDKPVEQRFAEFMVAMNAQDWPAAQQQLDALRKRLPPQAVGLLRAQAWFDLQRGELDRARQGYQQLLERLPGDEEAAVNLASVLSRQGQGEAARQVLLQAVQIRPDAPRLRDALRRFTPEVRP